MLNETMDLAPARITSGAWDLVEEALHERELVFSAASLHDIGFASLAEITTAVEHAMAICYSNGVSLRDHFKSIYISDQDHHTVQRDWKLSKFAYTLVMMNGDWNNPLVGKLQLEVLHEYLKRSGEKII